MPDPPRLPKLNPKPEGRDVVACVWLSMSNSVGPDSRTRLNVSGLLPLWLQDVAKSNKVPMAFCYGKDDTDARSEWAKGMAIVHEFFEREITAIPKQLYHAETTSVQSICTRLGIARRTFYRYLAAQPR